MSDYIERNEIKEALKDILSDHNCPMFVSATVDQILDSIPSADVRLVVLCRDCKHYKTKFCAIDTWHKDITIYKAKPDDFCSYGEL